MNEETFEQMALRISNSHALSCTAGIEAFATRLRKEIEAPLLAEIVGLRIRNSNQESLLTAKDADIERYRTRYIISADRADSYCKELAAANAKMAELTKQVDDMEIVANIAQGEIRELTAKVDVAREGLVASLAVLNRYSPRHEAKVREALTTLKEEKP